MDLVPLGFLSLELEHCCFLLQVDVALFAKPCLGDEVVGEATDDLGPFFVVVPLGQIMGHQPVQFVVLLLAYQVLEVTSSIGQERVCHGAQPGLKVA